MKRKGMADITDDLFFSGIVELNRKLRAKEFTAAELTRAFAERLEQIGPRYNALALPLTREALHFAKDVDSDLKVERYRGILQGIPFGAKDLLAYPKQPTAWGARPYAGQVFDYTATVLERLSKPGAVLIGKLAMVELAGGGGYRMASASMSGPGLNPWDKTRWSGGSSSGSGIAVAAGLVPFAIGSETSGSILTPSAFCGVTGLRPTYGLVSRHGAMALSWSMDKLGPMCRSAEDCGYVLQAIAGGDGKDPASAGKSFYYTPQYVRKMADIQVGFAASDFEQWPDESAKGAFREALEKVRGLGVQLKEVKLPDFPYGAVAGTIISAEGSSAFEKLIESGDVNGLADARQIAGLKAGLEIPARDYLKAMKIRSMIQQAFHEVFAGVDLLLTPTRPGPAPKVSQPVTALAERPLPKDPGLTQLIAAGNLAGLPALSVPCGFADGMPVAISLVGSPFAENLLLKLGREFQSVTDWHKRRPTV
jgi:aspartyl-tRNA(Asn)/glutamyl-tRNA(Gln) amidotransferase subunit A